jgi:hypothetical protein
MKEVIWMDNESVSFIAAVSFFEEKTLLWASENFIGWLDWHHNEGYGWQPVDEDDIPNDPGIYRLEGELVIKTEHTHFGTKLEPRTAFRKTSVKPIVEYIREQLKSQQCDLEEAGFEIEEDEIMGLINCLAMIAIARNGTSVNFGEGEESIRILRDGDRLMITRVQNSNTEE